MTTNKTTHTYKTIVPKDDKLGTPLIVPSESSDDHPLFQNKFNRSRSEFVDTVTDIIHNADPSPWIYHTLKTPILQNPWQWFKVILALSTIALVYLTASHLIGLLMFFILRDSSEGPLYYPVTAKKQLRRAVSYAGLGMLLFYHGHHLVFSPDEEPEVNVTPNTLILLWTSWMLCVLLFFGDLFVGLKRIRAGRSKRRQIEKMFISAWSMLAISGTMFIAVKATNKYTVQIFAMLLLARASRFLALGFWNLSFIGLARVISVIVVFCYALPVLLSVKCISDYWLDAMLPVHVIIARCVLQDVDALLEFIIAILELGDLWEETNSSDDEAQFNESTNKQTRQSQRASKPIIEKGVDSKAA